MECISISFKSAPEEVRKCFVFSEEEKRKILEQTGQAVVLNTCNRTEIYVTGGENSFSLLERLLADKSGMEETQLRRISRRFQGEKGPGAFIQGYLRHGFHGSGRGRDPGTDAAGLFIFL